MKRILLFVALASGLSLALGDLTFGHGGQYRGPGDTVPPGSSPPGGGGPPGSGGPSGPGPGTGGRGGPDSPGILPPGVPRSPGPVTAPRTGGPMGPDLSSWTFWWEFNKEPYLNLKAKVREGTTTTGLDDFFVGHNQKSQRLHSALAPSEAQKRDVIVPALIRALETETNNDIVTGALMALGKIGDLPSYDGASRVLPLAKRFLADKNQEISETAAIVLGVLGASESIDVLRELLDDSKAGRELVGRGEVPVRTRSFAAYGLGLVGSKAVEEFERKRVVAALVESLGSDRAKTRDVKVACILSLGLTPLATLEAKDGEAVYDSRESLVEFLFEVLDDDSVHELTRAHVATAIARLVHDEPYFASHEARLEERISAGLDKHSDDSRWMQQSFALALGQLADADASDEDRELRELMRELPKTTSDAQTRVFGLIALAQSASQPGELGLDATVARETLSHLAKVLSRGKSAQRPWAAVSLGVFGAGLRESMGDSGELAKVLASTSEVVRQALATEKRPEILGSLAIAAGILGDIQAADVLEARLKNTASPETRGYLCVALGLIDSQRSKPMMQDLVERSKYRPDLLRQAAIGLGLLGDKSLVDFLVDQLAEANSLASQASLAAALGFIGDRDAVEPLIAMLENQDLTDLARGFAAVALGEVADRATLPWNTPLAVDLNYRAATTTLNEWGTGNGILNIR